MNTIKIIILSMFFSLTGAQCWGAALGKCCRLVRDDNRLINAVREGNIAKVQTLLNTRININKTNSAGFTPLIYAAMRGHDQIVEILLDARASIDEKNFAGYTALMYAVTSCDNQTVQILLNTGANVNEKNLDGNTPLMLATFRKKNSSLIIKTLINANADPKIQNVMGETALHMAIKEKKIKEIKIIIRNWESITKTKKQKVIAKSSADDITETEQNCPVCLTEPTNLKLECGHSACQTCFKLIFTNNALLVCPLCRAAFTATDLEKIFT